MIYAIVESGLVSNLIEWDGEAPLGDLKPVAVPAGQVVRIGDSYDGTAFAAPAATLAQVQAAALAGVAAADQAAIAAPVTYETKGGVSKAFQADPGSIANLQSMLLAFSASQTVPAGFYWVAADNTQVPFVYADLQGLAAAIGAQGFAAFAKLQAAKSAINAAATVAAVEAISWS